MKKTSLLVTACAALIISSVTFAAEPPEFKGADSNADGGVDASEFAALKLEKEFSKLDENGDGKLSSSEYEAALEEECE